MFKLNTTTSLGNKLFSSVFALFIFFVGCFFVFQFKREKEFRMELLNNVLVEYSSLINVALERNGIDKAKIDSFLLWAPRKNFRVTIIKPTGEVIYDSQGDDNTPFDNHINRPEIKEALKKGNGYNVRHSSTFQQVYFYSASAFKNYIIRSSIPYNSQLIQELEADNRFAFFSLFMIGLVAWVLFFFSSRLSQSISRLKSFASRAEKNERLDDALSFPNDELGDISQHIVQMYNSLSGAKKELEIEREKLIKHFQFAKEGLCIFSAQKKEIFANKLFIHYINLISDWNMKSPEEVFMSIELRKITTFINQHIGQHKKSIDSVISESLKISKNGKTFEVECQIFQDKTFEISINDVSQEEEESTLKRQLTQNISHELKTPVSSIQGYIETMIRNPHLPEEKRQQFIERCFTQTNRLTHLLSDISLLNRMDEAKELFDIYPINVNKIIYDVNEDVALSLEEKHMRIATELPEDLAVNGNTALLYSIFRNLTDNAIAYAGEGVTITIKCYREDHDRYYFSFADNGVGIAEEHMQRLFDRFYRVDKGRTRKMGGTGLGLSIVKNAVHIHGGTISAKTCKGGGLEFLFTLQK